MTYFFRTLGLIWVLPAALLVWLFYLLPLLALGQIEWVGWDSYLIAKFRLVYPAADKSWYQRAWARWSGQGLPCAYIYRAQPTYLLNVAVFAHERQHCLQWFGLGLLFPLAYGMAALTAIAKGRDGYRDNWMEVDAKLAQMLAMETVVQLREQNFQRLKMRIRESKKNAQKK